MVVNTSRKLSSPLLVFNSYMKFPFRRISCKMFGALSKQLANDTINLGSLPHLFMINLASSFILGSGLEVLLVSLFFWRRSLVTCFMENKRSAQFKLIRLSIYV